MTVSTHTAESTSRTIEVQGTTMHYHEAGSGPVLVLLHGTAPGASAWGNFGSNLPVYAEKYRVLAIDLPHCGKSGKPANGYMDVAWYATVIIDMLDAMGIPSAHFLGNSVGGSVSIEVALARPEIVDRLILMGTAGSLPMFSPLPTEGARNMTEFYKDEPTKEKLERILRGMVFDQDRITPEMVERRFEASVARELLVHSKPNLDWMRTLWRRAGDIPHKTLLIYGRDDRVVPWDTALILLRLMPNADLHVFSQCGHWTQVERADEFNRLVETFLSDETA